MGTAPIRVLVVDDYEPWHGFVSDTLKKHPEFEVIGYVCDGLVAVQQAEQKTLQQTALRMLDEKCDIQLISKVTHLSIATIKQLAKKAN